MREAAGICLKRGGIPQINNEQARGEREEGVLSVSLTNGATINLTATLRQHNTTQHALVDVVCGEFGVPTPRRPNDASLRRLFLLLLLLLLRWRGGGDGIRFVPTSVRVRPVLVTEF